MFLSVIIMLTLSFLSISFNYYSLASQQMLCWNWDMLSSSMMSLTLWIIALICLCEKTYIMQMWVMNFTLMLLFSTKNMWFFFMYFEFSIIPILIIILLKGYQPERLEASISLLIYTFTSSTVLFFCVMNLFVNFHSWNFMNISILSWEIMLMMTLTFLVKLPMWSVHMWLPKAHVEAPVGGSMVLAAILLKLGVYGLFRMFMMSMPFFKSSMIFIASIGMIGMIMSAMSCFMTTDLKVLIAYSSVSHMSPIMLVLMNFNTLSLVSIIMLSLSHGFTSSLMFFVGNMTYNNSKTRLLMMQKGNMISNSLLTMILFWSIMMNLSIPPFFPFFSEILSFMMMLPLIFMVVILSGLYNIYMFMNMGFGKEKNLNSKKVSMKEMIIFFMHLYPLCLMPFLM